MTTRVLVVRTVPHWQLARQDELGRFLKSPRQLYNFVYKREVRRSYSCSLVPKCGASLDFMLYCLLASLAAEACGMGQPELLAQLRAVTGSRPESRTCSRLL